MLLRRPPPGFQKMNIFGGINRNKTFLGIITKLDYFGGSFLCLFLKVNVQNGNTAAFQIFSR